MNINIINRLDKVQASLLRRIGDLAEEEGLKAYIVGGPVRDLMLKRAITDIDICIEGNGIVFAQKAAVLLNGKLTTYPAFGTASVHMSDGRLIDFVTARKEIYPKPGVFPVVRPAGIKEDLFRRDFTVNAMAIAINPDAWGRLVDFYGGAKDLREGRIRILHDKSFIDDPTRILRAARFAGRLDFSIARGTMALIKAAIKDGAMCTVKGNRITKEMEKISKEKQKARIIKSLNDWGVLPKGEFNATHGKS